MALDQMIASVMAEADTQKATHGSLAITIGCADANDPRKASTWRLEVSVRRLKEMATPELARLQSSGGFGRPTVTIDGKEQSKLPPMVDLKVIAAGPGEKPRIIGEDDGGLPPEMLDVLARVLSKAGVTVEDWQKECPCAKCRAARNEYVSRADWQKHMDSGLTH